jgi:hypothetical protein
MPSQHTINTIPPLPEGRCLKGRGVGALEGELRLILIFKKALIKI